MKVLYYPKITNQDFNILMDSFETQYKTFNSKNRAGMLLAGGSTVFSWALAYSLRMRFTGFMLSTVGSFVLAKYAFDAYNSSSMKKSLNFVASNIAKKYPEIKYSTIEYTPSSDILKHKVKLI
jgi:hypothetical protein